MTINKAVTAHFISRSLKCWNSNDICSQGQILAKWTYTHHSNFKCKMSITDKIGQIDPVLYSSVIMGRGYIVSKYYYKKCMFNSIYGVRYNFVALTNVDLCIFLAMLAFIFTYPIIFNHSNSKLASILQRCQTLSQMQSHNQTH